MSPLGTLPVDVAGIISSFLMLHDVAEVAACAPVELTHFLPAVATLDSVLLDSRFLARASQKQRDQSWCTTNNPSRPAGAYCAYHVQSFRSLLLHVDAYAAIARRKLSPADAMHCFCDSDCEVLAILESRVKRGQLDQKELARVLHCALMQRRARVVSWLLAYTGCCPIVTKIPRCWRPTLLLAACQYDNHTVSTALIRQLLAQGILGPSQLLEPSPLTIEVQHICSCGSKSKRFPTTEFYSSHVPKTKNKKDSTIQHALKLAASMGNVTAITLVLNYAQESHQLDDPLRIAYIHEMLQEAVANRHFPAVTTLLAKVPLCSTTGIGSTNSNDTRRISLLVAAAKSRDAALLRLILADPRVNAWDPCALHIAVRNGDVTLVHEFITNCDYQYVDIEAAFRVATHQPQSTEATTVISELLTLLWPSLEVPSLGWELLDLVSAYGNEPLVTRMLTLLEGFPMPSAHRWRSLVTASRHGHADIVALLIARPAAHECETGEAAEALLAACHHDHLAVAKLLLPRVSPLLLRRLRIPEAAAAATEGTSVLEWMLQLKKNSDAGKSGVQLAACDLDAALHYACAHGRAEAARLLLAQKSVAFTDGMALPFAAAAGSTELMELLLADPRVGVIHNLEMALVDASREGHGEIVQCLLSHHALRITNDTALREAAFRGHLSVLWELLGDARVLDLVRDAARDLFHPHGPVTERGGDERLHLEAVYELAAQRGHYAVVWALLQDGRAMLPRDGRILAVTDLPRQRGDPQWCSSFLRRYLRHPRVHPTVALLEDACRSGCRGIVLELLRCGRVSSNAARHVLLDLQPAAATTSSTCCLTRGQQRLARIIDDLEHYLQASTGQEREDGTYTSRERETGA